MKRLHLEQYAGPFAMEESAFNAIVDHVNRLDLGKHMALRQRAGDDDLDVQPDVSRTPDGIACISIIGSMTKYGSSVSDGPSTIALRNETRKAANDANCSGLMLIFDTPGGLAEGTQEWAADIAWAGTKKPVFGFVEKAASAGFWAASQCTRLIGGPACIVGSIGTYGVLNDRSKQFEMSGVTAHVVRAGKYKGTGTPGTQITDDQLADQQRVVDQIQELFTAGVAKGRKMSAKQADGVADGRVHVGNNARQLGLIDQIGNFDDAMAGLRAAIAQRASQSGPAASPARPRSQSTGPALQQIAQISRPNPNAATVAQLKSAFPSSTSAWRERCIERGFSLVQASDLHAAHRESEQERTNAPQANQLQQRQSPMTYRNPDAASNASPKARLTAIAAEFEKQGMSREKAWARACKENESLRAAWCESHTAEHGDHVRSGHRA